VFNGRELWNIEKHREVAMRVDSAITSQDFSTLYNSPRYVPPMKNEFASCLVPALFPAERPFVKIAEHWPSLIDLFPQPV
jgi:hypothetical protein